MSRLLIVVASAQGLEGISAILAQQCAARAAANGTDCDWRILAETPPFPLDARFVSAAFTRPELRDAEMDNALAYSNREIAALREAQTLVISTPMYNFGMPGLLKSWFDQIIRPDETFESTGDSVSPYRGLLSCKRCVVLTVRGSTAFSPDGPVSEMNFLDAHLVAMLGLIGIDDVDIIDCPGVDDNPDGREAVIAEAVERINALGPGFGSPDATTSGQCLSAPSHMRAGQRFSI